MRKRLITLVVLLVAAGGGGLIAWRIYDAPKPVPAAAASPAVPVIAGTVLSHDVPIYLRGVGTVIAYNNVVVRSQVTGQLIKITFTQGQTVKKGDLLAQIDPRPYQAQLDQAIANRDRDQAQVVNAEANLNRYVPLQQKGYATPQLVDTQKAQLGQLQAMVKADEAIIEQARTNLSYTQLTSPIDGVTGIRQLDEGNIIHPTDPNGLVDVTQIQPISLIFSLPQTDFVENPAADGERTAHGPGVQPGQQDQAGRRQARSHRQPDRSDHRHDTAAGQFPQQAAQAVAGRARQCAAATRNPAQRVDDRCFGGAARSERLVRLGDWV
jgi:membrane fusion protein, multidrug efflux system